RTTAQVAATEALKQKGIAEDNAATARANEQEATKQRKRAEENQVKAEAQRSAARAQIYQSQPGELYTSTLFAIDSMERQTNGEAEEILRRNISLLPRPVAQDSQEGKINSLVFNKEGNRFVTGSADGTACLWSIQDGTKLFCTPSGQPAINAVAFSPDDSLLVIGDQSGNVQILDARTGEVQHIYQRFLSRSGSLQLLDVKNGGPQNGQTPQTSPVLSIQFRPPAGKQLAVAYEDGEIPVFDPGTGSISAPLSTVSRPNAFGFSANGSMLATGNQAGLVSIWNLGNDKITNPTSHRNGVLAMAFGKGNTLATSGNDKKVNVINLLSGEQLYTILTQSPVRDLAFSPDGTWLVTAADDHRIRVWDTEDGSERLSMAQDGAVSRVVISPDGQWLATTGDDRTTRVWDAVTGAEIYQIPLHASGAEIGFSNDENYLVSTDQQGTINIWDMSSLGARRDSIQFNGALNNIQYSASGDRLAVAGKNGIWLLNPDPASDTIARPSNTPTLPFKSNVDLLAFSPDSTYLGVTTDGKEFALYNNAANRMVVKGTWPSLLKSIAFPPDSKQLMASDAEGKIQSWSVSSGQPVDNAGQQYPQAPSLASSSKYLAFGLKDRIDLLDAGGKVQSIEAPGENTLLALNQDGSWLASSDSSGKIQLWKNQGGSYTGMSSLLKQQAESMSFNPDGSLLAVGTAQNVFLIDTASGNEIARIPYRDVVTGVSFSPDGKYLTTVSSNVLQRWEIAKLEKINDAELLQAACSRLAEKFNETQIKALFDDPISLCTYSGVAQ
ncbi:MAG: WD40 repeat domain-containing protein, partial [Bacteroidota bacterium]